MYKYIIGTNAPFERVELRKNTLEKLVVSGSLVFSQADFNDFLNEIEEIYKSKIEALAELKEESENAALVMAAENSDTIEMYKDYTFKYEELLNIFYLNKVSHISDILKNFLDKCLQHQNTIKVLTLFSDDVLNTISKNDKAKEYVRQKIEDEWISFDDKLYPAIKNDLKDMDKNIKRINSSGASDTLYLSREVPSTPKKIDTESLFER